MTTPSGICLSEACAAKNAPSRLTPSTSRHCFGVIVSMETTLLEPAEKTTPSIGRASSSVLMATLTASASRMSAAATVPLEHRRVDLAGRQRAPRRCPRGGPLHIRHRFPMTHGRSRRVSGSRSPRHRSFEKPGELGERRASDRSVNGAVIEADRDREHGEDRYAAPARHHAVDDPPNRDYRALAGVEHRGEAIDSESGEAGQRMTPPLISSSVSLPARAATTRRSRRTAISCRPIRAASSITGTTNPRSVATASPTAMPSWRAAVPEPDPRRRRPRVRGDGHHLRDRLESRSLIPINLRRARRGPSRPSARAVGGVDVALELVLRDQLARRHSPRDRAPQAAHRHDVATAYAPWSRGTWRHWSGRRCAGAVAAPAARSTSPRVMRPRGPLPASSPRPRREPRPLRRATGAARGRPPASGRADRAGAVAARGRLVVIAPAGACAGASMVTPTAPSARRPPAPAPVDVDRDHETCLRRHHLHDAPSRSRAPPGGRLRRPAGRARQGPPRPWLRIPPNPPAEPHDGRQDFTAA